jgi:tetratricopeptide (TPR) repeat protein
MITLSVGEYIRQVRRQKGQTQTDLGGTEYSKSYVSAVERGQIMPSRDALHFFAEQLDQSFEYLELLLAQAQKPTSLVPTVRLESSHTNSAEYNDREVVALLDIILQGKGSNAPPSDTSYPDVPLDPALILSLQKHARYAVLNALHTPETTDFSTAQSALEYALALAPEEYKSAILDVLGTNAYKIQSYEQALFYYTRARRSLDTTPSLSIDLFFDIELHCGNTCRMLGYHEQAQEHYEQARKQLRATHDMQTAGQLYLGLGYSTYAHLYQAHDSSSAFIATRTPDEVERQFQQALSFLLQSRTLCQLSSDWQGKIEARLTQAMVLLDLCTWRLKSAYSKRKKPKDPIFVNCTSLFDEIHEQCRQILLSIVEKHQASSALSDEQECMAYLALTYMICTLSRRATVARLGGYKDTAARESSLAYTLCQQVLQAIQNSNLSLTLIHDAINISGHHSSASMIANLTFWDLSAHDLVNKCSPFIVAEVYFTAGEMSEEVGQSSLEPDFVQNCYSVADECFSQALNFNVKRPQLFALEYDPSYLIRFYQRYTDILEQWLTTTAPGEEVAKRTFILLKNVLLQLLKATQVFLPEARPLRMDDARYGFDGMFCVFALHGLEVREACLIF